MCTLSPGLDPVLAISLAARTAMVCGLAPAGTSMERPSRATSLPKTVRWCDAMVQFYSVVTASPRSTGDAQVGSPSVCGALGYPGCERRVSDSVRAIRVVVDDLTV